MKDAEALLPRKRRSEESGAPYDLVVVGAGIAGLFGALAAAKHGRVLVICKASLRASTSYQAQGGIAAAIGADDNVALHAADTLRAGAGICRPSAVAVLTEEAPARIADLTQLGVSFDAGLGLEGGHSRRRIVHAGGATTGERVARVLAERVMAEPRIDVVEGETVSALWMADDRCIGVVTEKRAISARATLLATGGMSALWQRTTNPTGAVGDGIVLAYEAGAGVADLELMQFHPTALAGSGFLLSEALRGEGALLLDEHGERFVDELATRDVVSRSIAARGTALLDLRHVEHGRFATLMQALQERGHDPAHAPVPVAPAAHYTIGGIITDLDGHTEIAGLYAAGECASTGVHGANRLASNSLLECLVFGRRAAIAARAEPALPSALPAPPVARPQQAVSAALREMLWEHAGPVRDGAGLEALAAQEHVLARLIARCALARAESRGVHFRTDYPESDPSFVGHVVLRANAEPELERWS